MGSPELDLEWRLRLFLRLLALQRIKRLHESTPEEARSSLGGPNEGVLADLMFGRPVQLESVEDVGFVGPDGDSIAVRVYRPDTSGLAPGLVYFSGGGFVIGDLDTSNRECRRLAAGSGHVVCAVDYRLAPEHKFPAAVEDAFAAVQWIAQEGAGLGIATDRIAVAGESSGANLAAVVCQLARDAGGPLIDRQVLIYPATDGSREYPSWDRLADAPIFNREDRDWVTAHYLSDDSERQDPRASPLLGDLENLPPALIVVGEFDPLQDEVKAYATALREAGNEVDYRLYPRQPHGFLTFGRFSSQSGVLQSDIAVFLQSGHLTALRGG